MHKAAESLIGNNDFVFSIRTTDGHYLRRYLSAERFECLRNAEYLNRPDAASLRVEALSKANGSVQVWDIWLSKWFGGK